MDNRLNQKHLEGTCGGAPPPTLLESLTSERQSLIRRHNSRMKELNRAISLLESSQAESIIDEARAILQREN